MNEYFKNIYKVNKYNHIFLSGGGKNHNSSENIQQTELHTTSKDTITLDSIFLMNENELKKVDMKLLVSILRSSGYPYKNLTLKDADAHDMFQNLQGYLPELVNEPYRVKNITFMKNFVFQGKPTILFQRPEDYMKYNTLSDYFQEECRLKCKRYDQSLSPYDYWFENTEKTIEYTINKYKKINFYTLRESLYELILECTTFRPTVMVSIIKLFGGRNILDFSSGWGDRLLGAMACDNIIDFYCGVDPNSCLHPNYKKMIEFFDKDPNKYVMIKSEFQSAIVPVKEYNLIFTSPPYFIIEKYTDEPTQSTYGSDEESDTESDSGNKNLDAWLHNFLFFSLKKCWDLLTDMGHMIININDMRDSFKFVEKMLNYINKLQNSEYLGVISYGMKKDNKYVSPQPIWIWRKNAPIKNEQVSLDSETDIIKNTNNSDSEDESLVSENVSSDIDSNSDDNISTDSDNEGPKKRHRMSRQNIDEHLDNSLNNSLDNQLDNLSYDDIERLLNPVIKIVPETLKLNDANATLYIFRDDYLIGGTKQRIMQQLIESMPDCNELVYAGPVYGYAQIALSYGGKLMKKPITVFVETMDPLHPLTQEAKKYGAKIIQVGYRAALNYVQKKAEQYVSSKNKKNNNNNVCLLPFGLHTAEIIRMMADQIKKKLPTYPLDLTNPKNYPERMWLVAGSATLLNALYIVFPNTFFNVVQVGRTIWEDLIEARRTKIYVSDEKFYEKAKILPPYPSVSTYDAKLWKFVLQDAKDGDYVWNVGKDL
jgi:hypothetical protein